MFKSAFLFCAVADAANMMTTITRIDKELHAKLRRANKRIKTNQHIDTIQFENLQVIPSQTWTLNSLVEITITQCNLDNFPKQLERYTETLRYLDLSGNNITTVPRTFCCKMDRLTTLRLEQNQLQTLPIEVKFLKNLVVLMLSHNQLRMLPSTITDLKNLRQLGVSNNKLSQLPAFKMFRNGEARLKMLDVSFNPLDGASDRRSTFEVHPSKDDPFGYDENLFSPTTPILNRFPNLFQIALLRIVRSDEMLKLAAQERLPQSIVSIMQRDVFKCYRCGKLSILPAYNSTDILDYVDQVEVLQSTGTRHRMAFMKLFCTTCFTPTSN